MKYNKDRRKTLQAQNAQLTCRFAQCNCQPYFTVIFQDNIDILHFKTIADLRLLEMYGYFILQLSAFERSLWKTD